MFKKCIDVSKWQGDIDWNKVKSDGIEFAIIRTGYGSGNNQIDVKYKQNIKNAKTAGLKVGVYHYSYAKSPSNATQEARFCLSILGGERLDLPVFFDIEDDSIDGDVETRTQMCMNFCTEIEKEGYTAGVYANKYWFSTFLNYEELKSQFKIWLAHYDIDKPSLECDFWQYTSKGSVNGIDGDVDMNYMYDDITNTADDNTEKFLTTYVVKKGDTLTQISKQYGTTYQVLAEYNNISNPNKIYVGQLIKIPNDNVEFEPYVVKKGDTLWSIAERYLKAGNRYTEIKKINNLTSDKIYPGQILKIPQ